MRVMLLTHFAALFLFGCLCGHLATHFMQASDVAVPAVASRDQPTTPAAQMKVAPRDESLGCRCAADGYDCVCGKGKDCDCVDGCRAAVTPRTTAANWCAAQPLPSSFIAKGRHHTEFSGTIVSVSPEWLVLERFQGRARAKAELPVAKGVKIVGLESGMKVLAMVPTSTGKVELIKPFAAKTSIRAGGCACAAGGDCSCGKGCTCPTCRPHSR